MHTVQIIAIVTIQSLLFLKKLEKIVLTLPIIYNYFYTQHVNSHKVEVKIRKEGKLTLTYLPLLIWVLASPTTSSSRNRYPLAI